MKSFVAVIVYLFYFQCLPILNGQQISVIDGRDVEIADAPYMVTMNCCFFRLRSITLIL